MQPLYEFGNNLSVYQYSYYDKIRLFVNADLNRFKALFQCKYTKT
jgi:hypothetical protein